MDFLDEHHQNKYRSGLGMLLYLTKHSCSVRESSKCMDSVTWEAYNELLRVIKFVIDTKTFELKVQTKLDNNLGWNLKIFCDRNLAGDSETRASVTGFIFYLLDVPICWRIKSQKGVTLSSTEAKYVTISEAFKEVKFAYCFLYDLHIKLNLQTLLKTDNIGTIFMSENVLNDFLARHADKRYHCVREFIEDDFIKLEFVHSAKNDSDLFTKTVS
jgi:hypothetical protein